MESVRFIIYIEGRHLIGYLVWFEGRDERVDNSSCLVLFFG